MIRALPLVVALAVLLAFPASAATGNPWLDQRTFINMAHQGGEDEFPSNTMYAFEEALAAGADTLELDVNRTADDQFVVMHDWKVDRTTNGIGYTTDLTLAEIQQLDAGATTSSPAATRSRASPSPSIRSAASGRARSRRRMATRRRTSASPR